MGVCEPLMPGVVVPEAHQGDCNCVSDLSGPTFVQEFSMVGGYTEDLKKPQNCQSWGGGGGHLPGTIW